MPQIERAFVLCATFGFMVRRADPERVHTARLWGSVARLRDVWAQDPEQVARVRAQWPGLADAIDRLVELVRWDRR